MSDDEQEDLGAAALADAEREALDVEQTKGAEVTLIENEDDKKTEEALRGVLLEAGLRRKVPDLAVAGRDATESEGGGKRRKPRGKRTASSILRSVKGKILTWGKPDRYRLGTTEQREHIAGHRVRILRDEHQTSYAVPLSLEGLPGSAVRQVACGENITLALLVNGQVWMWGNEPSSKPIQESRLREFVIQVACGRAHMCAITDEEKSNLYTWGLNEFGQLGQGTTSSTKAPRKITTIPYRAVHIACGNNYTFMVADDGKTWGWGDNRHGQLGLGTMSLSEDGRTTEWTPSTGVFTEPQEIPMLNHEDHVHRNVENGEAYPRLMVAAGQEHAVAWGRTMRYASLTTKQVERMKSLEVENEHLKDELAEKKSIIRKYEGEGSGGMGGGQAAPSAAAVEKDNDDEGIVDNLTDDPLLTKVAKLVKHVKTESSRLKDSFEKDKQAYDRLVQDVTVMKAKAEVNAENQSKLWQQIADLHNSVDLAKENLVRVASPEEKEQLLDEIRRLEWQIADKEGVAKASDRFHETMLLEVHTKDSDVDRRRIKLDEAQKRGQQLENILDVIFQLRKERVINVKRRHMKDVTKDVDAFVEQTAKLYSKLDNFRVSNLVNDRETIEFLRRRLGHPPTFRNFLWHSDRLLGELLVDVDDSVKGVDPASIMFDVVNDLAGMVRSGIDQARLVNQYARGLMHTAEHEAQKTMRRHITTDLREDVEGAAIHKSLSEFMHEKSLRTELPEWLKKDQQ